MTGQLVDEEPGDRYLPTLMALRCAPGLNAAHELLNGELFHSVLEAKVVIDEWLVLYNTRRPHRGLGGKTLAAYAKMCRSHQDDDSCGGGM